MFQEIALKVLAVAQVSHLRGSLEGKNQACA